MLIVRLFSVFFSSGSSLRHVSSPEPAHFVGRDVIPAIIELQEKCGFLDGFFSFPFYAV